MMNMYDWENAFPKETEKFHTKLCNVLDVLPKEAKIIKRPKKRYVVAIVAAVMMLSSITAFATLKWNQRAIDNFGADEQMQEKLSDGGYSEQNVQSISENGVTVTLKQTIQDDNLIYILFNVTADNMEITEDNDMNLEISFSNGENPYSSISNGFVDEFEQPEVNNSRDYEIWIQKNANYNYNDVNLICNFSSLQKYEGKTGPTKDLVTGQWGFKIDLSANDSVEYNINKIVTIDGCDIKINRLKLSPISYTLFCDESDVKMLGEADSINFEECDNFYPLLISGINYTDGTGISEENGLMSEEFNEDYIAVGKFTNAIELDKIKSILLNDNKAEVAIK